MSTRVAIEIIFPDEEHRDKFIGQVSDGAMENMCSIKPLNAAPFDPKHGLIWTRPFGGATKFYIEMFDDWDE